MKRRTYSAEFKTKIVLEVLRGEKELSVIASENEIAHNQIRNWKAEFLMIERWFRTLKYDEVYLKDYENIKDARYQIGEFIHTYNFEKLHSVLGYRTPAESYYPAMLMPAVA